MDAAIASALAYVPGTETVTSNASTLGGAVHSVAAQVDTLTETIGAAKSQLTAQDAASTDLVTAGAVVSYVSSITEYTPETETVTSSASTIDEAVHAIASAIDSKVTTYDTYDSSTQDGELVTAGAVRNLVGSITASSIPVGTLEEGMTWEGPLSSLTSAGTVLDALGILNAAIDDVSSNISADAIPFVPAQEYSGSILASLSSATLYTAVEALDVAITELS